MRLDARKHGSYLWELFAKILGNALGGKLAQKTGGWKDRPGFAPKELFGQWLERNGKTGEVRKFRSLAGLVSEFIPDASGKGPYTFAFAFLTAYGRVYIQRIRRAFGPYTVVSQDTDGLWFFDDASSLSVLQSLPLGDSPGAIRVVEHSKNGRFFGPKHYYVDSGWTLSGFSDPIVSYDTLRVFDTFHYNPVVTGCSGVPRSVFSKSRTSLLRLECSSGEIFPDGWISPASAQVGRL
jgi:hypothetical protein